jgi:thiol-disulfide isomerase/thioredoxin
MSNKLRQIYYFWSLAGLIVAVGGLAAMVGCGGDASPQASNKFRPVEDSDPSANVQPAAGASDATPDAGKTDTTSKNAGETASADPALAGPTAEKMKQLRSLAREPEGRTEQQKLQNFMRQLDERVKVAGEIVAHPGAPEAARIEALENQIQVYSVLMQLGQEDSREKLSAAAEELAGVSDPKKAAAGKIQLFTLQLVKIAELQPRDGKQINQAIETLLRDGGDYLEVMDAAAQAAQIMEQLGFNDDAAAAFAMIGDHFAESDDPELVRNAQFIQFRAGVTQLQASDTPEEALAVGESLVEKVQSIVKANPGDERLLQPLTQVAMMLESVATVEVAGKVYDAIESGYGEHKNKDVAKEVEKLVESARKREALLGQPFTVEGELLDGQEFDWAPYQGKVVLVDFWATWCGPCLREMSNIKQNYDKFHEQGFEVVGINLDEELESVEQFFEVQSLPWATVVSGDDTMRGFEHPTAVKSGVDSIPFVLLIDREGKVDSIHVRGEKLEKALIAMLGEPKETEPPAPVDEDPPADPPAVEGASASPANSLR